MRGFALLLAHQAGLLELQIAGCEVEHVAFLEAALAQRARPSLQRNQLIVVQKVFLGGLADHVTHVDLHLLKTCRTATGLQTSHVLLDVLLQLLEGLVGVDLDFEVELLDLEVDAHSQTHAAVVGSIHVLRGVLLLLHGRHLRLLGQGLAAGWLEPGQGSGLARGLAGLGLHGAGAVQVLAHFLGGRVLFAGVMGWLLIVGLLVALGGGHLRVGRLLRLVHLHLAGGRRLLRLVEAGQRGQLLGRLHLGRVLRVLRLLGLGLLEHV